jgi:hypothetical protein
MRFIADGPSAMSRMRPAPATGWPVRSSLDDQAGSVPALSVAVIEGSRRFGDHAEQESRRIAHHLPGVSLLHRLGAEFLQPGELGRQVISVDIDMNPG